MRKIIIYLTGAIALFVFAGCTTVNKQAENVMPQPREDQGLVYFYREKNFVGWAISYNVKHDGDVIGPIGNGTYFFYFVDPGKHTFTAKTEAEVSRTLNIEAGKTYYISCGVDMGFMAGRPSMSIVDPMEGESVLPGLTFATK